MASIVWVPVTFSLSAIYLYWLSINLPSLHNTKKHEENDTESDSELALKFPSNLEELSLVASTLTLYKDEHMAYVLLLFCSAYLFKQTFAIPGSVFMNLLSGALFGLWVGFPLACFLSAAGASGCFLLSYFFGKDLVLKYFPDQLEKVHQKINENEDSLFFFLLFLRLFPMTPNWFLNIASPVVGITLTKFFFSVLFGLVPYNFITVQAGSILSSIKSLDDIFSSTTIVKLFFMALVALSPGLLLKKFKIKLQ